MKHKILTLCLAAAATLTAGAQELRTTYFMQTSNYRHEMNPALLDHGYVGMPLLFGNFNLGMTGNLGLKKFVYEMKPDWQGYGVEGRTLTTFMHPSVSADDFLGGLKEKNRFGLSLKYQLLEVAFKGFGGYNVIGLNLRSNTNLCLPKGLFSFMKTAGAEQDYDFSNLGVRSETYAELALGHSHKINDKLTIGAKMKFLFGLTYADFTADNIRLHMSEDYWEVTGDAHMSAALMGTEFNKSDKVDPDNADRHRIDELDDFKGGLGGFGLAFDLGATYKVMDDLTVSAAITDLGFISWKNAQQASSAGKWHFEGFENDIYVGGTKTENNEIGDQFEAIGDDLGDLFAVYDDGVKTDTRALAATLNVGAEYTLPQYRKLRFGFLYTSRIAGRHSHHQGQLSVNCRPVKWFEAAVNVAAGSTGVTGGLVLDLHAPHFNFFIGTDRFFGKLSKQGIPLNRSNANLSLGISFPMGK